MHRPILSMGIWLSLSPETRQKLREVLKIPRSGYTEVMDQKVICDGTLMEDLTHLTAEKMQKLLDTDETDFMILFNDVIDSIEHPPEVLAAVESVPELIVSIATEEIPEESPINTKKKKINAKATK